MCVKDARARYLVSGGSSFILEYGIFTILTHMSIGLIISNSLSFMVGLAVSFLLHKAWSFAGDQYMDNSKQFASYVVLAIINLVLTNIIIKVLVVSDLDSYIAKIICMVLIVGWNYVLLNKIIFKRRV